ncbi:hypothetical protein EHQ76_07200 [Leptospira barantonii]|uniref:Uncharacterized protein n=1 Tax=Leptospira barantonii TaxID=2023184 RepID=A0A5F2BGX9_9LEPT|nr:hypothetical protein [Leptospira barantonii]TGM04826.1 hypothetical protein EHQ76_07200 [Leptospira barantonii]
MDSNNNRTYNFKKIADRLDFIMDSEGLNRKGMAAKMNLSISMLEKYIYETATPAEIRFSYFIGKGWRWDWISNNKGEPRTEQGKNIQLLQEHLEVIDKLKRLELYESIKALPEAAAKKHSPFLRQTLELVSLDVQENDP